MDNTRQLANNSGTLFAPKKQQFLHEGKTRKRFLVKPRSEKVWGAALFFEKHFAIFVQKTMELITIEKGVPPPQNGIKAGRPKIYPFDKMEVGDSFFCKKKAASIYVASTAWRRKNAKQGVRFLVRSEGEGSRCWRLE